MGLKRELQTFSKSNDNGRFSDKVDTIALSHGSSTKKVEKTSLHSKMNSKKLNLLGHNLMADALPQHGTIMQGHVCILISA